MDRNIGLQASYIKQENMVIRKCEANMATRNVVFKVFFLKLESLLKKSKGL